MNNKQLNASADAASKAYAALGQPKETALHLKEIANRLKKLSYRDMSRLSSLIDHQISKEGLPVTEALLFVADYIESEAA